MVTLATAKSPVAAALATLHILAGLQSAFADASRFPKLCAAVARNAPVIIETWRNRSRRKRISDSLGEVVDAGHLPSLLALFDDDAVREREDADGLRVDAYTARIDAELAAIAAEAPRHSATARRIGAELAIAISAASLFATIVALAVA